MTKKEIKNRENSGYILNKVMIVHLLILLATVAVTATFTYALTSQQYLDEMDSQNDQIRALQNVIRKSNGLPGIDEIQ